MPVHVKVECDLFYTGIGHAAWRRGEIVPIPNEHLEGLGATVSIHAPVPAEPAAPAPQTAAPVEKPAEPASHA